MQKKPNSTLLDTVWEQEMEWVTLRLFEETSEDVPQDLHGEYYKSCLDAAVNTWTPDMHTDDWIKAAFKRISK